MIKEGQVEYCCYKHVAYDGGNQSTRLIKLDVTPAPRDNKCGFCKLTPVCRYDRWAPTS